MTRNEKELLTRIVNVIVDIANTSGIYSINLHEQLTAINEMLVSLEATPDACEEDQ